MNLNKLLESHLGRAHRRLHNVWLHDVADRMRLRRKAIARSDGLDERDVETYPPQGDVTIVHTAGAVLKPALLAAALLLGGAAGGMFAAQRLAAPPPKRQAEPAAGAPAPSRQFRITFWTEQGEPIEPGREQKLGESP